MTANELKVSVVLSEWVQKTVPLTGNGSGWMHGLCPFHNDHNPSLNVHDGRGQWVCYPCGLSGDIYDWLMAVHKISFSDAFRMVCDAMGITFHADKAEIAKRKERREVLETLSDAALYFKTCLGEKHREVLRDRYNLTDLTIDQFDLGFAHAEFRSAMNTAGYSQAMLQKAGLLDPLGDFPLQGRLTIPYRHVSQTVYISGRLLDGDSKYKYLHLPMHDNHDHVHPVVERTLFNVDRVMGASKVYVVEGVFDAMAIQQRSLELGGGVAGVAISGATISDREVALLRSYGPTADIIVTPDGDDAGVKGALRSASLLMAAGAVPSIWPMPVDADPASLGDRILELSPPVAPAEIWVRILGPLSMQEREQMFQAEVLPLLNNYPMTQRDMALDAISSGLNMKVTTLQAAMRQVERQPSDEIRKSPAGAVICDYFEPLAYDQTKNNSSIVLWSKRRDTPVWVDLTATSKVYGILAPHMGNLHDILTERWPDADAKERHTGLEQALFGMSQKLPRYDSMTVMRSGLHLGKDGTLVLIGQDAIMLKEEGKPWKAADQCIHGDKLMLRDFSERRPWIEWTVNELNKPLMYSPQDAYELLWDALRTCWSWFNENDARLWALNCFSLTWSTLWDVMPWFHITAPAMSGKSTLCEGFLGGRGLFGIMGGPFLINSAPEEDCTEAAIRAKFSDTMRTLILDEFEAEDKTVDKILRLMRTSRTGGGSIRGMVDGGYRDSYLNMPLILSSIQPVLADSNASRLTVTRLQHTPGWKPPVIGVRDLWAAKKVDTRELRRTILTAFADNALEVQAFYRELQTTEIPSQEKSTPRGKENLSPAICVSRFLGSDWKHTSNRLFTTHMPDMEEMHNNSVENQIEDTLLNMSFPMTGSTGTYRTTIWRKLGAPVAETAPYGFAWDEKYPHLLYVYPKLIATAGPLAGLYSNSARVLLGLLRECRHHLEERYTQKGGLYTRWQVFNFADVAEELAARND